MTEALLKAAAVERRVYNKCKRTLAGGISRIFRLMWGRGNHPDQEVPEPTYVGWLRTITSQPG